MKAINSLDLTLDAINHRDPAPVPFSAPIILAHAAKLRGITQREFHTDSETLAETVLFGLEEYKLDGVYVSSDNHILSEAMGSTVRFPEEGYPDEPEPLLADSIDLNKLSPAEPKKDGRMPMMLDATEKVLEEVGETHFVEVCIDSGPFSLAATLRGPQQIMLDVARGDPRLTKLLEMCTETVRKFAKAVAEKGAHGIQFGDATSGILGLDHYKHYALPYEREIFEAISEYDTTRILHICGDTTHILESMATSGADCIEVDSKVDIGEAAEKVGNSVCLKGNIDTSLILRSSPEELRELARKTIKKGAINGGLILNPGCEVPKETPPENLHAIRGVARQASPYSNG